MEITFTKISDKRHRVTVRRNDGSSERVELDSRTLLRHDMAHFAIELEMPIKRGFWGCVSHGASLTGDGIEGVEAEFAESLAGPLQTLMRLEADPKAYLDLLHRVAPAVASTALAARVHERIRRLRGHWKATRYGGEMKLIWPH